VSNSGPQSYDLAPIRSDGWLEQLAAEIPEFDELCRVVGRRFVAFSFIAGVRISAVAPDRASPHASTVEFAIGDAETVQRMPLSEFRERLGALLLADADEAYLLPVAPATDDLRRYIGRRYVLLAPLFGIRLDSLERTPDHEPVLVVDVNSGRESITVDELRDALQSAVRAEVARARPSGPFSIDFKKVPQAEEANRRGAYDQTIALLGAWPGPLSMFLRTPQGQALGASERSKLVRALGALGEAYVRTHQVDWAEDVLRLGIQFGQELPSAGPLFGLLGAARVETERYGEAIGLLQRAISLGADRAILLPDLARCFVKRGRYVAAAVCVEEAIGAGANPERMSALREEIGTALGPAWDKARAFIDGA
jgi:tetratricopeptide (TPR) repeat protein